MRKHILIFALLFGLFITSTQSVHAQMMGSSNTSIDQQAIQEQQAEEQEGKKLFDQLKNKTITCQKLTDNDFDKIGEYFMGQSIGDTSRHIAMNNMMKSMMGENGEEQIHITWGKRGSECMNTSTNSNQEGGYPMMCYGMMNWMMGGMWGYGFLGFLTWILVIIDLVLLIIFLWKQIQKK